MTARRIEDYALIGDLQTAALIGRDGALEWLCFPRFESDACFASLLGDEKNGCWTIRGDRPLTRSERRYAGETLVLETTLRFDDACVRVTDFMPRRRRLPALVRIVEGIDGTAAIESRISCRFAYGKIAPWTRAIEGGVTMIAGADALVVHTSERVQTEGPDAFARLSLGAGAKAWFSLQWYPSHEDPPVAFDPCAALDDTLRWWSGWSGRCRYDGAYRDEVLRSLITLKALTFEPTGGTVAAATTSLPERFGGAKNWDYRYAWLRDSAFTVSALVEGGYHDEARAWRDWLLRMIAGTPEALQIMYSVLGNRRLDEYEATWLSGYGGARPVRIGNAAFSQFQLGVYGETIDAIARAHEAGVALDESAWTMLCRLLDVVEARRHEPDQGIWESRAAPKHYTLSHAMVWLAFDRAVRAVDEFGFDGPVERWRRIARETHDEVCARGYRADRGCFVQSYESQALDASVLLLPIIGFLPADDPRIVATIATLERELLDGGFLLRTSTDPESGTGASHPSEGAFLACNFWLVECYAISGRIEEARSFFEQLLGVANDVGLLSEEYDPPERRQAGNVPQTLTHAALVNAAVAIERAASRRRPVMAASA